MIRITKIANLSYFSDRCCWIKPRFRLKTGIMNHSSGLIVCYYWCLVTINSVFKLGTIFCQLIAGNTDLVFSWLESALFIPFRVNCSFANSWDVQFFEGFFVCFFDSLKPLKRLPRTLFLSLLIAISKIFSNNFGWMLQTFTL